jgi:antitoxin component of MazEF toxin-antitoxin module
MRTKPFEASMIETKILRVGEKAAMALTTEMLDSLDAREGDTLYVVREDDGSLRVMTRDPELSVALAAAEIVMDENRDLLQALA